MGPGRTGVIDGRSADEPARQEVELVKKQCEIEQGGVHNGEVRGRRRIVYRFAVRGSELSVVRRRSRSSGKGTDDGEYIGRENWRLVGVGPAPAESDAMHARDRSD